MDDYPNMSGLAEAVPRWQMALYYNQLACDAVAAHRNKEDVAKQSKAISTDMFWKSVEKDVPSCLVWLSTT